MTEQPPFASSSNVTPHPLAHSQSPRLRPVSATSFVGNQAPARRWVVRDYIPAQTVVLLSGDGATGKSLLMLQLAVASATRRPWLGMPVQGGRSLYLSAEDDIDELHRRIDAILKAEKLSGQERERLADLDVISMAGEDAVLASPNGHDLRVTPLFHELEAQIRDSGATFVVLDTLADIFAGEENQRSHARQFISLLRGWCAKYGVTIVVLAHPSLTGLQTRSGQSGSTGWSNSVRSRLYLEVQKENPDRRTLSTKKANYARSGRALELKWQKGVFCPIASLEETPSPDAEQTRETGARDRFLALLKEANERGDRLSDKPGKNYAPSVLARSSNALNFTKAQLRFEMENLLSEGKIRVEEKGPKTRVLRWLIVVEEGPK